MAPSMKYWDDWVDVEDMEAMWNDPNVRQEWLRAGEERGMKVHMSRNFDGKPYVTHTEMKGITEIITRRFFKRLDVGMICAIAEIESAREPLAYRYEQLLKEASTGLMQTLQSTAEWLAKDMGYRAYEIEGASALLYRPFVSVYFGAAYLKWLSTYDGKRRNEEFMVRGYNGGPNGATKVSTLEYWNKYLQAKQNLPKIISDTPLILEIPVVAIPEPPPPPTTSTTASCSTTISYAIPQPPPPLVDEPSPSLVEQYARRMAEKTAKSKSVKSSSAKSSSVNPSVLRPSSNIKASVQPTVRSVIGTVPSAASNLPSENVSEEWTYWDEKVSPEDLDAMWRHPEVKKEWTASNEKKGEVRFARDADRRPYLTTTEAKAIAEMIVSRYFAEQVNPIMLQTIADVSSKRRLYGADKISGVMQTPYPTAVWLYKEMGYKAYKLRCLDDLSNPFLAMYFGAAYVCWLSNYDGRPRSDEFVVRGYRAGPCGVEEPIAGQFWQKYSAQLQATQQELQRSGSKGGQWTTNALWRGTDPALRAASRTNQSIWRRLWA